MTYKTAIAVCLIISARNLFAEIPSDIVKHSGIKGGVVVHLGCGDGRKTADMRLGSSYLVHGLDTSSVDVANARAYLRGKNLYGPVSVAQYDGKSLPYADNTVNLIVADTLEEVPVEEAMRVLTPLGAMLIGGKKTIKPWPKNIDDWPQYLNKADNNAVAKDTVAGPPRLVQWVDKPVWCRSHMGIATLVSVVTGKGRLFTIEDAALPDNPFLPSAFRLVARDAFNGKELWSRKISRWESVTMYIKCLPVQQQRRMAVAGDSLYCTLALDGPVSALDAATGEVLRVYENTSPTQEVAYDQGVLYLNVGDRVNCSAYNIVKRKGMPFVEGADPSQPFYGGGFKEGYPPETKDKDNPTSAIVAIDAKTGKELWAVRNISRYSGASMSIKGEYLVYQTAGGLFCISAKTGERVWTKEKQIATALGHDSMTPGKTVNTVVLGDDKVFAVECIPTKRIDSNAKDLVYAYSLKNGKELWHAPIQANYEAAADVCYVNGTLWIGGNHPTQLNVETGAVMKTIVQKMTGPMGHDRCYRNFITERYFVNTKTGGADFLELQTGKEFPNHWTRGGCGMGVLPANGLLYSTPFSCSCSMGEMFQGFSAYASPQPGLKSPDEPIPIERCVRLEKGPAFGQSDPSVAATVDDWPTYRRDGFRSGITSDRLPASLKLRWETRLPAKPSAVTIAAGKVFVCVIDEHTLYALEESTGKMVWTFTADGRIDSPPTYHQGMLFFGGRDGWVYCIRAADGALAWRFKDLPDRLIGAYGQLESKWPVCGSVLILGDRLYFAAGRTSYLDGGIFVYALDPRSGEVLKSRACYGPFDEDSGFPAPKRDGFKNDVLVTDGTKLYLRHKAFDLDLSDASGDRHIIPTSNFLDSQPQHRTCWTLASSIGMGSSGGDIMVSDGKTYYEVHGFPIYANHSYFDPRKNGYTLFAGSLEHNSASDANSRKGRQNAKMGRKGGGGNELWHLNIPLTGKAIAMAGDVLFVAGEPMKFDQPTYQNYVAAYNGELGGRLIAVSAADGRQLAEYKLPGAPAWDGMAVANRHLYIALSDGSVQCLAQAAGSIEHAR